MFIFTYIYKAEAYSVEYEDPIYELIEKHKGSHIGGGCGFNERDGDVEFNNVYNACAFGLELFSYLKDNLISLTIKKPEASELV